MLLINGNINDTCFTLVNLYAPRTPNERISFFKKAQKFVQQKAKSTNIIISGDMNTIDDKKDRSSQKIEKCSKAYTQMKTALHITDSWRYLNNTKLDYTYTSNHAHITHSRIDHILISNSFLAHLCKAEIIIAPAPDHKAVNVVIDTEFNKRGKGYWKLNNALLNEESYRTGIVDIFKNTTSEYVNENNIHIIWELCKIRFKEFSIKYSIKRCRTRNTEQKNIERDINILDQCIQNQSIQANQNDIDILLKRKALKMKYDTIMKEKAEGAKIRSKVQWWEEGETSSAFFLNLEKHRQANNNIKRLKAHSGELLLTDKLIIERTAQFYEDLYHSHAQEDENKQTYIYQTDTPQILTIHEKT